MDLLIYPRNLRNPHGTVEKPAPGGTQKDSAKEDWREGNGRPKGSGEKSKIVEEWQRQHPDGKKADC